MFLLNCEPNELGETYNPLATLVFNTEGGTIRQFFNLPKLVVGNDIIVGNLLAYFACWYLFTITTYGIWVPAGIFVPGILMGCTLGVLYLEILVNGFGASLNRVGSQSYLVIGSSAMLAGYTRLTYSLAVIMMETT